MEQSHHICTLYILLLIVHVSTFKAWMNIDGSRLLEDDVLISCGYITKPGEEVQRLFISQPASTSQDTVNNDFYFYVAFNDEVYLGTGYHSRLSLTINGTRAVTAVGITQTVTMKISRLSCFDEKIYGCCIDYNSKTSFEYTNFKTWKYLYVRARPTPPTVTTETTRDYQSQLEQKLVREKTTVVATCHAGLGRPGQGRIQWRLFRSGVGEKVPAGDPRILPMVNVSGQGNDSCKMMVEQVFTMVVTRRDQNLVIACYVYNPEFPGVRQTDQCQNSSFQLCGESQQMSIIPGSEGDDVKSFVIAALVLVAGFVTAVVMDIIYHCFCSGASKPEPTPAPPPPTSSVHEDTELPEHTESGQVEENLSIEEDSASGSQV